MDVSDALDSYLTGHVRAATFWRDFETEWYKPMAELAINMALKAVKNSPELMQNLEGKLSPGAMRKLRGE